MATQSLKHQNGTLAYDDTGSGPLVIDVRSMGGVRGDYCFLVPQLVAAGYRCLRLGVRGSGQGGTAGAVCSGRCLSALHMGAAQQEKAQECWDELKMNGHES